MPSGNQVQRCVVLVDPADHREPGAGQQPGEQPGEQRYDEHDAADLRARESRSTAIRTPRARCSRRARRPLRPARIPSCPSTQAWAAARLRRRRGGAPTAASVARSARPSAADSETEIATPSSVTTVAALIRPLNQSRAGLSYPFSTCQHLRRARAAWPPLRARPVRRLALDFVVRPGTVRTLPSLRAASEPDQCRWPRALRADGTTTAVCDLCLARLPGDASLEPPFPTLPARTGPSRWAERSRRRAAPPPPSRRCRRTGRRTPDRPRSAGDAPVATSRWRDDRRVARCLRTPDAVGAGARASR